MAVWLLNILEPIGIKSPLPCYKEVVEEVAQEETVAQEEVVEEAPAVEETAQE